MNYLGCVHLALKRPGASKTLALAQLIVQSVVNLLAQTQCTQCTGAAVDSFLQFSQELVGPVIRWRRVVVLRSGDVTPPVCSVNPLRAQGVGFNKIVSAISSEVAK